jgi:hypothetical protein
MKATTYRRSRFYPDYIVNKFRGFPKGYGNVGDGCIEMRWPQIDEGDKDNLFMTDTLTSVRTRRLLCAWPGENQGI